LHKYISGLNNLVNVWWGFFCSLEIILSIATAIATLVTSSNITGETYQKFLNTAATSFNTMASLFIAILGTLIVLHCQYHIDFENEKKHIARCGGYLLIGFLYSTSYNGIASLYKPSNTIIDFTMVLIGLIFFLVPTFSVTFLGFEVVNKVLKIPKNATQKQNDENK